MPPSINAWRTEIFQSLDIKLDQIIEEDNMETIFETTNRIARQFDLLDVCPTKEQVEAKINELSYGRFRRPVMMIAIDGADAPTRPEPSDWKGKRGKGKWKEAKGFRVYLIDSDRIVHLISRHQIQEDKELAKALSIGQKSRFNS
jgi:hypothetical protein